MSETILCNLCGAGIELHKVLFLSREWDTESLNWQFPVVKCRKCGLTFVNPRPGSDKLSDYYKNHIAHDLTRQKTIPDESEILKHEWRYRAVMNNKPEGHKILDVGSGDGTFLKLMEMRGWDVTGVETESAPAEYARKVLGLKIFDGDLEIVQFPDDSFDVVTFYQVLEHVPDPLKTLKEAYRILAPGGTLIVNIPNISTAAFWIFGKHYYYLQIPLHLFFFSPATLSAMSESVGYRVKNIAFSSSFDAFAHSILLFMQETAYRLGFSRGRGRILMKDGDLGDTLSDVINVSRRHRDWKLNLYAGIKKIVLLGLCVLGWMQQKLGFGEIFSLCAGKPERCS